MSTRPELRVSRELRFPLLVALAAILLILISRFWGSGVGFGFGASTNDKVASGILVHEVDNLTYVAWAQQATTPGVVLFSNPYTLDKHPQAYFNPYFWLVGQLARLFNVQPLSIMIVQSIMGAFVIIVLVYYIARWLGFSQRAARWACLLAAFSSGLSFHVGILNGLFNIKLPTGTDLNYIDTLLYPTMYAYPYHTVAFALLGMVIALLVWLEADKQRISWKWLLVLWLLTLFTSSTHPYESIVATFTYGLYSVLSRFMADSRETWKQQVLIFGVVATAVAPVTIYSLWLSSLPVWADFARISLNIHHPRSEWIVGYGVPLALALYGCYLTLKSRYRQARWMAIWVLLLVGAVIIVNVSQTKITNGGHWPIVLMAGLGFDHLLQYTKRSGKLAQWLAYALALLLFFLTSIPQYSTFIVKAHRFSKDIPALASTMQSMVERPTVLADFETSLILPAIAPIRVWAGHWALTPDYDNRIEQLKQAGIEPGEDAEPAVFQQLLDSVNVDFIVLPVDSRANQLISQVESLEKLTCLTSYCLYRPTTNR